MPSYLQTFKQLISDGKNSEFRIAARYQYFVSFYFPNGINAEKLGYLVQSVDIPDFSLEEDTEGVIKNEVGSFKHPGLNSKIIPSVSTFSIEFLDTETPVFETFFIPWLHSVINVQTTGNYPFLRGDIRIDYMDNPNDKIIMTYKIIGAYPTFVDAPDSNYKGLEKITRKVNFACNRIELESVPGSNGLFNGNKIIFDMEKKPKTNTNTNNSTYNTNIDVANTGGFDESFRVKSTLPVSKDNTTIEDLQREARRNQRKNKSVILRPNQPKTI